MPPTFFSRSRIALLVVGLLAMQGPVGSESAQASGGWVALDAHVSAEQEAFVADGLERFEAAGLQPPLVKIRFHESTDSCRLRRGLYGPDTNTVEICTLSPETLVHELAHAWVAANLSEDARLRFTAQRGVRVWNDHSLPWAERGTEHAATIIGWGLGSGPDLITWVDADGVRVRRLLMIPNSTADELATAYRMLTGRSVHPDRLAAQLPSETDFSPEAARSHPR